jgi:hypothetical protein
LAWSLNYATKCLLSLSWQHRCKECFNSAIAVWSMLEERSVSVLCICRILWSDPSSREPYTIFNRGLVRKRPKTSYNQERKLIHICEVWIFWYLSLQVFSPASPNALVFVDFTKSSLRAQYGELQYPKYSSSNTEIHLGQFWI